MQVKNVAKFAAGTALVAALGLAAAAHATDQPLPGTGFAGIAGNGNTGTDAFGQTWTWSKTTGVGGVAAGLSAWGLPGLGDGEVDGYNGSVPASDFFIAFLTSMTGTYINTAPSSGPGGYNEETRFTSCNSSGGDCVAWTPVYDTPTNPLEVNFIAPAGTVLVKGDDYFVNVIFTTGALSGANAGFSAVYSANVPEPAAWAMMLLGIAGVGGAMRSARRKQGAAVVG
jgi:opacity protein-like surface antigen